MKDASLPQGVEVVRCWCGSECKVKEVTDFSDMFGMKFFMCPNHKHDPPVAESPYKKAPVCFFFVVNIQLLGVYYCCFTRNYFSVLVSSAPMPVLSLDRQ